MIVFDLACSAGHVFEAWFGSREDYDGQQARGLVSCPVCGDARVEKAPMAPRIATSSTAMSAPDPKMMMQAMMTAQSKMLAKSEDVGPRFAEEARAIHDGEADDRLIHGRATIDEAKGLINDGVPVMPLPFPVREPGKDH